MFTLARRQQEAIKSCARDPKGNPCKDDPQGNPVANPPQHQGQQVQPDP